MELMREELVELVASMMEEEGFEVYEPVPSEDYLPDLLAVYEEEGGSYQIAIQVEDCAGLETELAESRARHIARHCRASGEGFLLFIPMEWEELGREKFEEWGISDVAELIPVDVEFEEDGEV